MELYRKRGLNMSAFISTKCPACGQTVVPFKKANLDVVCPNCYEPFSESDRETFDDNDGEY
jgi:ribosomal protein S27E